MKVVNCLQGACGCPSAQCVAMRTVTFIAQLQQLNAFRSLDMVKMPKFRTSTGTWNKGGWHDFKHTEDMVVGARWDDLSISQSAANLLFLFWYNDWQDLQWMVLKSENFQWAAVVRKKVAYLSANKVQNGQTIKHASKSIFWLGPGSICSVWQQGLAQMCKCTFNSTL